MPEFIPNVNYPTELAKQALEAKYKPSSLPSYLGTLSEQLIGMGEKKKQRKADADLQKQKDDADSVLVDDNFLNGIQDQEIKNNFMPYKGNRVPYQQATSLSTKQLKPAENTLHVTPAIREVHPYLTQEMDNTNVPISVVNTLGKNYATMKNADARNTYYGYMATREGHKPEDLGEEGKLQLIDILKTRNELRAYTDISTEDDLKILNQQINDYNNKIKQANPLFTQKFDAIPNVNTVGDFPSWLDKIRGKKIETTPILPANLSKKSVKVDGKAGYGVLKIDKNKEYTLEEALRFPDTTQIEQLSNGKYKVK